jgi:hypothetical protein
VGGCGSRCCVKALATTLPAQLSGFISLTVRLERSHTNVRCYTLTTNQPTNPTRPRTLENTQCRPKDGSILSRRRVSFLILTSSRGNLHLASCNYLGHKDYMDSSDGERPEKAKFCQRCSHECCSLCVGFILSLLASILLFLGSLAAFACESSVLIHKSC